MITGYKYLKREHTKKRVEVFKVVWGFKTLTWHWRECCVCVSFSSKLGLINLWSLCKDKIKYVSTKSRKKTCANVKQKDAYINYGSSPQYSIYLNIGVSKIKIEIARFNRTNENNVILEEAYISIIVHTLFRKNWPWK